MPTVFPPIANLLASLVLAAAGVGFMTFAVMVFVKPVLAERFLMAFASTARAHYLEQTLRLLLGVSLLVLSPLMWGKATFYLIGWGIVLSTIGLMLMPWRWHNQLGKRVLPRLVRRMKLYAVGVFVSGAILLFALSTTLEPHVAL